MADDLGGGWRRWAGKHGGAVSAGPRGDCVMVQTTEALLSVRLEPDDAIALAEHLMVTAGGPPEQLAEFRKDYFANLAGEQEAKLNRQAVEIERLAAELHHARGLVDEDLAYRPRLAEAEAEVERLLAAPVGVPPEPDNHHAAHLCVRSLDQMAHEFHTRPGATEARPAAPTLDVEGLPARMDYLAEEYRELREALAAGDVVRFADALGDMTYVLAGTAWRTAIPLDPVLAEVHRSNMTKLAAPGDGKAIKGPGYSPPDIASVLAVEADCG